MIKYPDAPATSKQLWYLHTLTGEDTKDWKLTMQEASDKIAQLESGQVHKWHENPPEWEEFIKTPMSYADVRLFFGDQGQGKSVSTVACVADDVHRYVTHVVTPEGEILKANALNEGEQKQLLASGVRYNPLKHMRVFSDDGLQSKIVSVPNNYSILSPVKVFANRTLYGFKFMPFDLAQFIQYINTPLMTNGWVILSESVLISKKDTMSHVGRFMEWFGAECRKRHLRMAVDMQYRKMLAPTFHLYATTNVECSYDPDTMMVSLDVNDSSPTMVSTQYDSLPYRRFYNTDEIMEIPQHKIDRAMEVILGGK